MLSNTRMQRTTNLLRLALVCASLLVVNGATAWADIAPDPLSGGKNLTIKGRAKTNVVMADEVVKLRVSRDVCQTEVVFTMKNSGTKAESMQVGFPHYYPDELKDFKATVDDKPVKVTNATVQGTKGTLDSPGSPTVYWKTWETTFAPDHPVKIAVSYSIKLKERALMWLSDDAIAPQVLVSLLPKDDQPQLEKQLAARRVKYILVTGSHWSGPIGRCRIEVTLQGMTTENLAFESLSFEKDQAIITRDKMVWDLKDYEPQKDVEFAVTPNTTRAEMLKLLEKLRKRHPRDPSITKILSGFLIEAKRQPEADKIMLELLTHWRDKITLWEPERERGESLQQSWDVFEMISRKIHNDRPSTGFQNPSQFAPVIERIALRVQGQLKFIPPNEADEAKLLADKIDKMLEWSKSHAMPD